MAPTRIATPLDAGAIAADIAEGFAGYRAWAPSEWHPPVPGSTEIAWLADALQQPDVWCLLALESDGVIGHVALSRSTREDPGPLPAGVVYLWQLFVRPSWQGRGIAKQLMQAAVTEAAERGFGGIAAVDTTGCRPRPTLL
jgi:predicted N-acetyltransferase YhbS